MNITNEKDIFNLLLDEYIKLNDLSDYKKIHLSNSENSLNEKIDKCITYMKLLLEKNKQMNLTSITEPSAVISKHFIDSISLMPFLPENLTNILDIGTGAGFPSIPVNIFLENENISMDLLDSTEKKLKFINEVISSLELKNIRTIHARAEEFAKNSSGKYDLVISRAVARLPILLELSIPFLKTSGTFIALKGPLAEEELLESKKALKILGCDLAEIKTVKIPINNSENNLENITHSLVIVRKISSTPPKYPRMFSKIQKSPL